MRLEIYKIDHFTVYCRKENGQMCFIDKCLLPKKIDIQPGDTLILKDNEMVVDTLLEELA